MKLKRTYKLFETTVLREYQVTNIYFYLIRLADLDVFLGYLVQLYTAVFIGGTVESRFKKA